jgi:exopolysaccharide/PEP-CTERM locus tyrosine autokinase
MGKISDAFERHQKEKLIKLEDVKKGEDLKEERPRLLVREDPETTLAREIGKKQSFSDSLVMLSSPDSADAENFKILRGKILFPRDRPIPRSILVTSTFPGEGKTFVASNLAATLALSVDEYVLLIDADLRRARIHRMFGFSNVWGLHDLLIGDKRFEELVVKTDIKKLSILPAGKTPQNPTELLSSSMMARFLEEARTRYKDRFIIIDSPPSLVTAEAEFLSGFVDGIIFVVLAQKTPREDIKKAIENLGREKMLGVVFNGYDQARKSYYKYYEKYYKKSQ